MDLFSGFCLSFLIVIILYILREINNTDNKNSKIEFVIGWSIILFSIILGFTIGNFYNRYIETRNMLVDEVANLQIIYSTFKVLPDSENVIDSMKAYLSSILCNDSDVESSKLSLNMNEDIIDYFNKNQENKFLTTIMNRVSPSQKLKMIKNEIKNGQFFINILWFLFTLVIIPFYSLKICNKINQSIIEFFLVVILVTGIILCEYINDPFKETPLKINHDIYADLLNEINKYQCKNFK